MSTFCSGPCRQGRDACATPDACRRHAEDADSLFGAVEGVVRGFPYVVGAWAFIAAVAALAWWLA